MMTIGETECRPFDSGVNPFRRKVSSNTLQYLNAKFNMAVNDSNKTRDLVKILIFLISIMFILPTQSMSYIDSVGHMLVAGQKAEHEHEMIHMSDDSDHHSHSFSDANGEHRHDPNSPMHSHAKELTTSFLSVALPAAFKVAKVVGSFEMQDRSYRLENFVFKPHYNALLRPPIA